MSKIIELLKVQETKLNILEEKSKLLYHKLETAERDCRNNTEDIKDTKRLIKSYQEYLSKNNL